MPRNKIIFIVAGLLVIAIVIFVATRPATNTRTSNTNTVKIPKRCAEELKLCPDGSTVGRNLPKCDFSACPALDPTFDLTKDWKEYVDDDNKYSIKYPPTWSATKGKDAVTISTKDVLPLAIKSVTDDTPFYVLTGYFRITIDGVTATQADDITPRGTTRMVWIPRDDKFLTLSWPHGSDDAPYYQILSTLHFLPQ